ncbi:unnamed protein product [Closterium sp. Naga37s-1]|nr:unnamed protein product [Closterium sp. Naga37s-1]
MSSAVTHIYLHVIQDVIKNVRPDFQSDGVDESVLQELQQVRPSPLQQVRPSPLHQLRPSPLHHLWEAKVMQSGAVIPVGGYALPPPAPPSAEADVAAVVAEEGPLGGAEGEAAAEEGVGEEEGGEGAGHGGGFAGHDLNMPYNGDGGEAEDEQALSLGASHASYSSGHVTSSLDGRPLPFMPRQEAWEQKPFMVDMNAVPEEDTYADAAASDEATLGLLPAELKRKRAEEGPGGYEEDAGMDAAGGDTSRPRLTPEYAFPQADGASDSMPRGASQWAHDMLSQLEHKHGGGGGVRRGEEGSGERSRTDGGVEGGLGGAGAAEGRDGSGRRVQHAAGGAEGREARGSRGVGRSGRGGRGGRQWVSADEDGDDADEVSASPSPAFPLSPIPAPPLYRIPALAVGLSRRGRGGGGGGGGRAAGEAGEEEEEEEDYNDPAARTDTAKEEEEEEEELGPADDDESLGAEDDDDDDDDGRGVIGADEEGQDGNIVLATYEKVCLGDGISGGVGMRRGERGGGAAQQPVLATYAGGREPGGGVQILGRCAHLSRLPPHKGPAGHSPIRYSLSARARGKPSLITRGPSWRSRTVPSPTTASSSSPPAKVRARHFLLPPSPSVKVRAAPSPPVRVRAPPPPTVSASQGLHPPFPPVSASKGPRVSFCPPVKVLSSPLSAIKDGKPMIRNGETGDWIGTFEGHKGAVWGACLDRPALLAATASADFTARIWDALTGDEKHKLEHKHIVRTVDFSKDSRQLLTGGAEKVVRVFDLARPDAGPTLSLEGMAGPVRCARWHNDDRWILVTCNDVAGVKVFDARSKDVVGMMATDGACLSMDISPAAGGGGAGGSAFITTADGSTVKIFDAHSLQEVKSHRLPHQAESASYIPSTNRFVAGGEDLWVRVFDYETGQQLECHKGHHGALHSIHSRLHCIRFAPDALSYASGSEDGTIRIWKLAAPAATAHAAAAAAAGSAADAAASGADAAVPPMAASQVPSSAPPAQPAAPAAPSPSSPPPPNPTARAPLSLRLWRDARSQRVAQAAAYHPFVLALGAGTLPRRRFVRYSLQDAFFLSAFAQSYGAAASLLDGGEEDGTGGAGGKDGAAEGEEELSVRAVLQRLQWEADGELQMHAATVKAWIEESSDSQAADATADITSDSAPLPATLEYTSFLSHVVAGTRGVWDSHGLGSPGEQGVSSAGQRVCNQGSHHSHAPYSSSCSSSSESVVPSRPADWIAEGDRSSPAARRWHTLCVLAAMLPCMRLYASIGHTMGGAAWGLHAAAAGRVGRAEEGEMGARGSSEGWLKGGAGVSEEEWRWHPYGQWLHTYSCQGFEVSPQCCYARVAVLDSPLDVQSFLPASSPCLPAATPFHAALPCCPSMLPFHAALPCCPSMLPFHAALPCCPSMLPFHAALPCCPSMLPFHAALPCCPSMLPFHAALPCCPSMLPFHAALPCCPSMLPFHAALPCCPSMLPFHAALPCCPSMLPFHAALPCCPSMLQAAAALLESAFDRLWSLHLRSLHHSCQPTSPTNMQQQQQHVAEQHLSRVYSRAMQLELSFFHAQLAPFPASPQAPLPHPHLHLHAPTPPPYLPAWPGFLPLAARREAQVGREASGGEGETGNSGCAVVESTQRSGSIGEDAAGVVFAVDFDGTCTVDDSSSLLARLALAHAAPTHGTAPAAAAAAAGSGGEHGSRQQVWDDLVQRYVRDYSDFMHTHLPPLPPPHAHRGSSSSKQVGDESRDSNSTASSTTAHLPPGLLPFLHRLSSFEAAANQRVTAVAALQGIPRDAMLTAAREAADVAEGEGVGGGRGSFRSGCARVLRQVEGEGGVVQVVSVSWCGAYVGEAVRHAMRMAGGERREDRTQEEAEGKVGKAESREKTCSGAGEQGGVGVGSRVVVRANEMEFDEHDLLPLLRAQVGVVMAGGASSLGRVVQAFGVHRLPLVALALLHVQQGAAVDGGGEGLVGACPVLAVPPWTVFDACSWEELEVFLFGAHRTEFDNSRSGSGVC